MRHPRVLWTEALRANLRQNFHSKKALLCLETLFLAGLIWMAAGLPAYAQSTAAAPSATRRVTPPMSHLYWHMMTHQNHLDRAAAAREQLGKDGSWLRNYYQQKLGFTNSEFQPVREAAQRLEIKLKQINDRAKDLVTADRNSHPHALARREDLPAPIAELSQLSQQHESALQSEMDNLRKALGEKRAAKLDDFLMKNLAPKVTMRPVPVPHPHGASRQTMPAFPQGVQQ